MLYRTATLFTFCSQWCYSAFKHFSRLFTQAEIVETTFVVSCFSDIQKETTLFLVSTSQLQKWKSAPRNDSRLEKRLGTTWGYKNKINEKQLLSNPISGTRKSFPLSLQTGDIKMKTFFRTLFFGLNPSLFHLEELICKTEWQDFFGTDLAS